MESIPSFEDFKSLVVDIRKGSSENTIWMRLFNNSGDKTSVFDYVDDDWYEYIYGEIKKVFTSSYLSEKSDAYKSAYLTVEICLRHKFFDGNKRSSLLALTSILFFTNIEVIRRINPSYLYGFIKQVASDGNKKREENINKLAEYLE